jgi:hypothetical protein
MKMKNEERIEKELETHLNVVCNKRVLEELYAWGMDTGKLNQEINSMDRQLWRKFIGRVHLNDFSSVLEKLKVFTVMMSSLMTEDEINDETKTDAEKVKGLFRRELLTR